MSDSPTSPTTPSAPTGKPGKPSAGRVAGMWAKEIAIVVVGALIASTLLRLFVAQMFVIPSGSMENGGRRHSRSTTKRKSPSRMAFWATT